VLKTYFKIRLLLTGKCTAKCHYCHNEGQSKSANLLTLTYIKDFIQQLEYKNDLPDEVVLSGGEPTLHKQVKDIARFLKSKKLYVSMASHIGHTELLMPVLPYLDELKIHLDSFDYKEQQRKMGVSLENVISSINLAKEYPINLIINHPLNNTLETASFLKGARAMNLDCKIIEVFGSKRVVSIDSVDWGKVGYIKDTSNSFKYKDGNHKLFFKRCSSSSYFERTLFVGAEGVRSDLQ